MHEKAINYKIMPVFDTYVIECLGWNRLESNALYLRSLWMSTLQQISNFQGDLSLSIVISPPAAFLREKQMIRSTFNQLPVFHFNLNDFLYQSRVYICYLILLQLLIFAQRHNLHTSAHLIHPLTLSFLWKKHKATTCKASSSKP